LARTLEAAPPVGSTILELDWTADLDSFATPRMLLSSRRNFKHAENDPNGKVYMGTKTGLTVYGLLV
jgi:hypothetical protein